MLKNHDEELKTIVKESPFHRFAGKIPSKLESEFVIGKRKREPEKKEDFIRILLAMVGLLRKKGFELSVTRLSIECGVNSATISRWLTQLKSLKQLEPVSGSYFPGVQAKTYKATNELAESIANSSSYINF